MLYIEKLSAAIQNAGSCLCVGLDPNLDLIPGPVKEKYETPEEQVSQFLKKVIEVTSEHCAAFKPNLAFFEALGPNGLTVFSEVLSFIPEGKIVIADAKRGDISSTAEQYARAYFEVFNVDAITLNPLMGFDTLEPFYSYPDKCIYVLALTSNPGADDFLNKPIEDHPTIAAYIADHLEQIRMKHPVHTGMVVGATHISQIREVIDRSINSELLIPGVGTQGGSIEDLKSALQNHRGTPLVSSSRSILYAGKNEPNWLEQVAGQAKKYKEKLKPLTERYVARI